MPSSTAQWIWLEGQSKAINAYLQFRRSFSLPADAKINELRICSNEHYRLFINGRWIRDGAARFEKPRPYADMLSATGLGLKRGQENCIAIQCVQTGLAQHGYALAPGGLYVELRYSSGGRQKTLRSDRQWRCRLAPAFHPQAPRKFFALQFNEYIDSSSDDKWFRRRYDDSAWSKAVMVKHRALSQLQERPIPLMQISHVLPQGLRRYEALDHYDGIYGLHWDCCANHIPKREATFVTQIYVSRDSSCHLNVACDNYARFSIDDEDIIIQGEPDSGFVNHLGSERASYKGMSHGHGLRHEGAGSRPSSAAQQLLQLSKGWHTLRVWIWRPRTCNGFALCLMNKRGRPLRLPCSSVQDRSHRNNWALEHKQRSTAIIDAVPDQRPHLEVAHLNDWLPHRPLPLPRAARALCNGGSWHLPDQHAIDLSLGGNFSGYISFTVHGARGAILDICVSEAQQHLEDGPLRACYNGMWQGDRIYCNGKRYHFFSSQRKAGRYLKFIARNASDGLTISDLKLHAWAYPVEEPGAFQCNDQLLSWMWQAGANTVNASTFDLGEDCPTREQAQWTGDMYLRFHQIAWLWGDLRLSAKALRETAHDQPRNDWARPICPSGYGDKLVDYCPLLPIWLLEHYAYTADEELLRDCFRGVQNLFVHAESLRDQYGIYQPGDHQRNILYIDYSMKPYPRCGETTCHLQVLLFSAYRHAAAIAEILGKKRQATTWRLQAARLQGMIHQRLWHERRGLFADGISDGQRGKTFSAATNYYALWSGVCSPQQETAMIQRLWLSPQREDMHYWERGESPYTKFFACRALLERGYWRQAFSMWRKYYKNMARHPECYSTVEWWQRNMSPHKAIARSSLVHPFAIGSMADFAHCICGLLPATAGFGSLLIKPQLGDLRRFDAAFPLAESGRRVELQLRSRGNKRTLTVMKDADLPVTEDLQHFNKHDRLVIKDR